MQKVTKEGGGEEETYQKDGHYLQEDDTPYSSALK